MSTPRKRAVIYCRVSTDKQEQDGESLEYQEEKCRQYAALHDTDVVAVLLEAKSGYIHYSLREKLTLARQMVRDKLADMIIRGISHKLTEDGILPPAKSRGAKVKGIAWHPSTVYTILRDVANIGILQICKITKTLTPKGTITSKPNPNMKTIPDGLPAIVPIDLYELAQIKLKANKSDKSHIHRNPEDFLLKGHLYCKTCGYRMHGRYQTSKEHIYTYYACIKFRNKYDACPDLTTIRTDKVDQLVWADCCRVFERLETIRTTIERNIEQSLQRILEDTTGQVLLRQLRDELAYAKQERDKHPEGSYYYRLTSQDVRDKEAQLLKHESQTRDSQDIVKLSHIYRTSILGFLDFLNVMQGKYHEAPFKEKRNALDVLGVKVYVHPTPDEPPVYAPIEIDQEWLSIPEASALTGISLTTLNYHIQQGALQVERHNLPQMVIHRTELCRYLALKRPHVSLNGHEEEWFTVNKLVTTKLANYRPIHHAIQRGELTTQTLDVPHPRIHRDELNRFLRESPVRPRETIEDVQPRIEITYTPIFTGVQSSFG